MKKDDIEILEFKRPDDERLLCEIIDLAQRDVKAPESIHRHDFFEIAIILKGSTKHLVDFKEYNVNDNEILVIPHRCIHQGGFKENLTGYVILFTRDFFTSEQYYHISGLEISNPSYGYHLIRPEKNRWSEISQLLQSLVQEYNMLKTDGNHNILRYLLLAFSLKLNTMVSNGNNTQINSHLIRPFFELLENNFTSKHFVAFYSGQLNISPKKLGQTLAQTTGKTTLSLITERLILEAKRELLFSKKTIKEIAFYLGFEDQLYFSKYFKKHTGLTPLHLRKNFAEISI